MPENSKSNTKDSFKDFKESAKENHKTLLETAERNCNKLCAMSDAMSAKSKNRMMLGKIVVIVATVGLAVSVTAGLPGWVAPIPVLHTAPWCLLLLCIGQWIVISALNLGRKAAECHAAGLRIGLLTAQFKLALKEDEPEKDKDVVEQ